MAELLAFRGIRYDAREVGNLDLVVSPPYDVIDPDLRRELYRRSSYNIARIDYGEDLPGDDPRQNRYTRAAAALRDWLEQGILRQDPDPSFYYMEEDYRGEVGEPLTRKGVLGAVRLENPGSGLYHPHEKTLAGPKADRLKLMQACRANLSPIFGLYDDPGHQVLKSLEREASLAPPAAIARANEGSVTRLWRVTSPGAIDEVTVALRGKGFFIADGHHRYETALAYRDLMRGAHPKWTGSEPWNYVMMYLSNLWAPGLTILPTHRAAHGLGGFRLESFFGEIRKYFQVEDVQGGGEELGERMRARRGDRSVFGLGAGGSRNLWILTLREGVRVRDFLSPELSEALSGLDVTVLHGLILERILGIGERAQEEQANLEYIKDPRELIRLLLDQRVQLGFFMNPTRIEQVKAVAEAGERMPQKSTFFYPKLLTGLVIKPLADTDREVQPWTG